MNEYNEISEGKILQLAPVLKTTENNSISDNTLDNATLRGEGRFAQEGTSCTRSLKPWSCYDEKKNAFPGVYSVKSKQTNKQTDRTNIKIALFGDLALDYSPTLS